MPAGDVLLHADCEICALALLGNDPPNTYSYKYANTLADSFSNAISHAITYRDSDTFAHTSA